MGSSSLPCKNWETGEVFCNQEQKDSFLWDMLLLVHWILLRFINLLPVENYIKSRHTGKCRYPEKSKVILLIISIRPMKIMQKQRPGQLSKWMKPLFWTIYFKLDTFLSALNIMEDIG